MVITLYTKVDCSLCDKAKLELELFRGEREFELIRVDIASDAALFEKYKHDIPVLEINGREAAKHFLNQKKLRTLVERQDQKN